MTYKSKLLDPKWQKVRLQIFERDGWKCRICDNSELPLHAHHTYYRKDSRGPWDYDLVSIVTLCEDCHFFEHDTIEDAKIDFFNALAETNQFSAEDLFVWASYIRSSK